MRCLVDTEPADGRYVLYWMQASQRAEHNDALEHAIGRANRHGVPLVVLGVVIPDYPKAAARHVDAMLGGLVGALQAVERRGARPCLRVGDPVGIVRELAAGATSVVVDRGELPHQRAWYEALVDGVPDRPIEQVEANVVVPIDLASDRHETAARTFRPRVHEHLDRFLVEHRTTPIDVRRTPQGTTSDVDLDRLADTERRRRWIAELGVDDRPGPVDWFRPGAPAARARLDRFLDHVSEGAGYSEARNRYTDTLGTSRLSPWLHFGQISPVAVALEVRDRLGPDADGFLEELVVRRELAFNHARHVADPESWSTLPDWARRTLDEHRDDERPEVLTASALERGETDDDVWNTIMATIRRDGWVHNQLRMYWGKQIVRWTNTPQHAFRTLIDLNDRWFLDGRDPNSSANCAWCFGLHDRGFPEGDVRGTTRPFTTAALKRKDDLGAWLDPHARADD